MRRTNAPALAGPLSFSAGDLPAADAPVGHGPTIRPPIVPIRASCGSLVPRTPASKPLKNHADWYVYKSEEHTSELQSLMRISYAVFCLKKNNKNTHQNK